MRARIFAEENRKWWTLGAVAFGLFMIMLDNTIVAPGGPRAAEEFVEGFQAALVVAAAIAFAGALVSVATVRKYRQAESPLPEAAG